MIKYGLGLLCIVFSQLDIWFFFSYHFYYLYYCLAYILHSVANKLDYYNGLPWCIPRCLVTHSSTSPYLFLRTVCMYILVSSIWYRTHTDMHNVWVCVPYYIITSCVVSANCKLLVLAAMLRVLLVYFSIDDLAVPLRWRLIERRGCQIIFFTSFDVEVRNSFVPKDIG